MCPPSKDRLPARDSDELKIASPAPPLEKTVDRIVTDNGRRSASDSNSPSKAPKGRKSLADLQVNMSRPSAPGLQV